MTTNTSPDKNDGKAGEPKRVFIYEADILEDARRSVDGANASMEDVRAQLGELGDWLEEFRALVDQATTGLTDPLMINDLQNVWTKVESLLDRAESACTSYPRFPHP